MVVKKSKKKIFWNNMNWTVVLGLVFLFITWGPPAEGTNPENIARSVQVLGAGVLILLMNLFFNPRNGLITQLGE